MTKRWWQQSRFRLNGVCIFLHEKILSNRNYLNDPNYLKNWDFVKLQLWTVECGLHFDLLSPPSLGYIAEVVVITIQELVYFGGLYFSCKMFSNIIHGFDLSILKSDLVFRLAKSYIRLAESVHIWIYTSQSKRSDDLSSELVMKYDL